MNWLLDLTGVPASVFSGDTFSAQTYGITDFRDDAELLLEWGIIHRRSFTWQPSWGDKFTVYSAKHPTAEAASIEARRLALEMGYKPPKWWQFWRLNETSLPA